MRSAGRVWLLLFALALLCAGAKAAEGSGTYISDFSKDTDGWTAGSGGEGRILVRDGVLRMEGRNED